MANDDRQSQQFIREVDEELRRSQLKAIWDHFAWLIIGVCILVVLITAGYRGWLWWQERQAAQAGDRFMAAVEAVESGDRAAGEAELTRIAAEGGNGYSVLARLRLAGEKAAAGGKPEALAAYDAVAADGEVSAALRDVARIRSALVALDSGDLAGARERAQPLDAPGNPWRHAAREVLGTAAYQSGELAQARDYFTAMQQDAETPSDLWVRSGMMVSLIDGQIAPPAGEAGTAAPAQPTEASPAKPSPPDAAPAAAPAPAASAPADPVGEAPGAPVTGAPASGGIEAPPAPPQ